MSNEAVGYLVLYAIVGVFCGLIAGLIASKKRRSGAGFFFLGFFFPIIGIVVAVLAAPGVPRLPNGMVSVVCPRCNAHQNIAAASSEYECWQCKLIVTKTSPL